MNKDFFTGELKMQETMSMHAPVSKAKKVGSSVMGWVARNHAELLAVVLIGFAIMVVCVDEFSFEGIFWQTVFSPETLLLATCSYMLYINSSVIGDNVANKSEFAVKVNNTYDEVIATIRKRRIEWKLELFCNDYKVKELKRFKTELLLCAGFSEKKTAAIIEGDAVEFGELTDDQKQALKKVKSLKPIRLNKTMLINARNEHIERSPIRSATAIRLAKYRAFTIKLITTALSFVFVVSLSLSLTRDFSWEAIMYALFQVALMIYSLLGGISIGYKTKLRFTERIQDIIGVLHEFEEWLIEKEKEEKKEQKTSETSEK